MTNRMGRSCHLWMTLVGLWTYVSVSHAFSLLPHSISSKTKHTMRKQLHGLEMTTQAVENERKLNWIESFLKSQQPLGMQRSRLHDMMKECKFHNNMPVVVITGATGGIGRTLCKVVVEMGGKVIAVDVNQKALADMVNEISSTVTGDEHNNVSDRIIPVVSDFGDLDSVSDAADVILDSVEGGIDILVNNAGIFYGMEDDLVTDIAKTTPQGYDACFSINYLSHFLLTEKLLPKLSNGGGRVVHVTSGLHYGVDGSGLKVVQGGGDPTASFGSQWTPTHVSDSYGNTKLAQIWHACWLNRRCSDKDIVAVSACPSWAATGIAGKDNDEGRELLEQYAFSTKPIVRDGDDNVDQVAGPAVTSILNAMFCSIDKLGPQALLGEKIIGNSRVFDTLAPPPAFVCSQAVKAVFGSRARFVYTFASVVVLVMQRWLHDELILQSTSPESVNTNDQDALCMWSKEAVSPWLRDGAKSSDKENRRTTTEMAIDLP